MDLFIGYVQLTNGVATCVARGSDLISPQPSGADRCVSTRNAISAPVPSNPH